jgi:O-antigen ligase
VDFSFRLIESARMTSVAYAGLWIFVFAVPWERLIVLPGLSIVTRATGALALGLTLLAIVISGRVRRWRVFHTAAFLFVIWTGFAVWVLGMPRIPLKYFTFVQLFLVLWMIWELAPTYERLRGLLAAYVFGCCVPAIATILLYLREGGALRRFSAGDADANSLGMTLALAVPIAWYLSLTCQRPLLRWLYRGYLPVGLFATALSGSRGAMIALIVSLLVIPLTTSLSPGRLAAAIGLLGLSGALVVAYVPDKVIERLSTTGTAVETISFGGRFKIWTAGVRAFTYKPLMGYGAGGFKRAVTPQLGAMALVAHNSFLSVLVEEGMVGFFFYMTMFLSVFLSVLRFPRLERRFGLVLLATLGTTMLPLTWEDQKAVWFIIAALIGMSSLHLSGPVGAVHPPPLRRTVPAGSPPMAARS